MLRSLPTIIGPSIKYFKVLSNAIQACSLGEIPQVYNTNYNIKLYKSVKTGCKLADGCKIMSLLTMYSGEV